MPSGLIVYIPNLEKKQQERFTKQLGEKLNILFRFVDFQQNSSLISKFKSLIGSTLLICPQNNYNPKKAINRNWLYPKMTEVKIQANMMHEQSTEQLVDSYYKAILNKLHKRFI